MWRIDNGPNHTLTHTHTHTHTYAHTHSYINCSPFFLMLSSTIEVLASLKTTKFTASVLLLLFPSPRKSLLFTRFEETLISFDSFSCCSDLNQMFMPLHVESHRNFFKLFILYWVIANYQTMLWWFQVNSEGAQLYTYICVPSPPNSPPIQTAMEH